MSHRILILFCGLTLIVSWLLQWGLVAVYGSPNNPAAVPFAVAIMYEPALMTLAFAIFSPAVRRRIAWRPRLRMLEVMPVAILVPTVIGFMMLAVVQGAGWGRSDMFDFASSAVLVKSGPWVLGMGSQDWLSFLANVLLTGCLYAVISSLAAIGEELGWRGFLQGALLERLGPDRAITLLGVIWALWHLPALLAGFNYPANPVLGALVLFPLQLVAASYFLGWLTLRSGSFWAAAVAHGAVNSVMEAVASRMTLNVGHLHADVVRVPVLLLVGALFRELLKHEIQTRATQPANRRPAPSSADVTERAVRRDVAG